MKRILHLISQLEGGGAQRQLAYLLSRSKQHEFEIASLIASPPDQTFFFFRDTNIPIHFLSFTTDFYALEIKSKLDALLDAGRFSIVHTWLFQSMIHGVGACRKRNIPCIVSPRSMYDAFTPESNKRWERFLIKRTLKVADAAICPSNSIALDFLDRGWLNPDRTRTIYNGVDTDHFHRDDDSDGTSVVSLGRLSWEKSFEEFEAIAARLHKKFPEIRCLVAGPPIRKSAFVEYLGFQDDVRGVLKQAAIYVSTSKTEGMSNALLEALSMGIPAVVRRLGSNSEIIENEVNGFLVETEDDFVRSCELLLTDSSRRKEMGENARRKAVLQFSIRKQVEKLESAYSELL